MISIKESRFKIKNSIPRFIIKILQASNKQVTFDISGKKDTFENNVNKHMETWLNERYGEVKNA